MQALNRLKMELSIQECFTDEHNEIIVLRTICNYYLFN